ncbi:MAG TPA: GAF domain-containing protein, partial [Thermoleophilia bacterium]|nr:GAF domain-containing protein [Thermoleophilia bacterium]
MDAEHEPADVGVTPRTERRVATRTADGADQSLAAALASREGLAAFVAEAGRVLDVWLVDVWVFDREREVVIYEAVWRRDGVNSAESQAVGTEVPLDQRPDLALLLERRALVERHIDDPDLSADVAATMKRRGYRSSFDVPLFDGGEVVGVLGLVERRAVRRLDESDLDLLARVCRLAELGVRGMRSRRSGDEHAELLQTLVDSSRALAAGLDQHEILAGLREAIERLLPGVEHEVEVWLRREDESFERLESVDDESGGEAAPRPLAGEAPDTLIARAIARRRPAQARTAGEPTRLVVPLVVAGRAAGYIDVRGRPLRRMTPAEIAVLQALGDHVAVALEHRRLGRSLDRQAAIDTVTGFFSRWYFYDHLYSETTRAARYKQPLSVVLVGVDGFERLAIGRGRA